MPNPQQPELARARRSDAVVESAAPGKATRRPSRRKAAAADAPGPIPEDNRPGHQPDVVPDKPTEPPAAFRVPDGDAAGGGHEREAFSFEFDPVMLPFSAAVGATPWTTGVTVTDDELEIRFGPWHLATPLDNVAGAELTGPYRMLKTAGPPHLSFRDRGVTFATNRRRGVCIRFREPVAALLPRGPLRHPAATVTVAAPDELVRRLTDRPSREGA